MAAARLGYCVAPPEVVEALDKVVLPYHLDAVKQVAGELALDFEAEMRARVAALVEERGRLVGRARPTSTSTCSRPAPTSCCSAPGALDGADVWQGLLDRSVLVRDCSSWPRLEGCLRVTIGTPGRGRRLPRRPHGGARHEPVAPTRAADDQGDVDRRSPSTSTAATSSTSSTGLPFFDHMLDQLGRHGGFDLHASTAEGDLHVDGHHTVEDTGIVLGEAFREALGDKAGVARFASGLFPLDEALVEVALDLSGRPFCVWDVPVRRGAARSATRRSTRRWPATSGSRFATAAGITLHVRKRSGDNTHHVVEASFKGVARCLRAAVRVEGDGVPSTKGSL